MALGRPTDYRPEFAERAIVLCEAGALDVDLAREFEVSVATIYNWKLKHPDFLEATKMAKEVADRRVERSLFERATGYSYPAVKIMSVASEIQQVPYIEHVPPDTASMIFWLKNRRPSDWRDKQEVVNDVTVKSDIDVEKLSPEKRSALKALLIEARGEGK